MVTIKYEEGFKKAPLIATKKFSEKEYEDALKSAKMHTDCIHLAELKAAAVLCCCSIDNIEWIEKEVV